MLAGQVVAHLDVAAVEGGWVSISCILRRSPLRFILEVRKLKTPESRSAARPATASTETGFLREASTRLGVSRRRMEIAVHAAQVLTRAEFGVVEELLALGAAGLSQQRRTALSVGLVQALETLSQTDGRDPLAGVDDPLASQEALATLYGAAEESRSIREQILRESISVGEAAELTGRSRQALERQRRAGRLLALRRRNQWRYPRWQFDPDAPGGVVPGVAEVLQSLGLSPAGTAFWLRQPRDELGGKAPIALLHQRRAEPVLGLAREQGIML